MSSFNATTTSFEVAAALSDQIKGKTVLITGCSPSSLGATTAEAVASQNPGLIILAGRSEASLIETDKKLKAKVPSAKTRLLIFDLANFESVRKAAAEVNAYPETVDALINNAGIMACPYEKTVDGFEVQFATNHLGHFLFTNLLLSKMLTKSRSTFVNVTSGAYQMQGINWEAPNPQNEKSYNKWPAYAQSKTANILFAVALAEKLSSQGVLSFSADPGVCGETHLGKYLTAEDLAMLANIPDTKMLVSSEVGTASQVRAAFDSSLQSINGGYLKDCQPVEIDDAFAWAKGTENANRLWKLSEELVGQRFAY